MGRRGRSKAITDYWYKYYCNGLCTLCGNAGIIDNTGARNSVGTPFGCKQFCICPNGQVMRGAEERIAEGRQP